MSRPLTLRRLADVAGISLLLTCLLLPFAVPAGSATPTSKGETPMTTAHDFQFTTIDGAPLPMKDFAGKAVLVVNTASQCGFTPQYEGLQGLWESYRERGLVVLGVPSNDFAGQEPGSEGEIKEFCTVNFGVDFPMTAKESVKDDGAHPFYAWARDQGGFLSAPKWNFHKYLIGPDGRFADWFSSMTKPESGKVRAAIEKVLPE